jgi:hypothetical protein
MSRKIKETLIYSLKIILRGTPKLGIYASDIHQLEGISKGHPTLGDVECGLRKRPKRRDKILRMMDDSVPWDEWVAYIAP